MRVRDLNSRPSGYEPDALPLRQPAKDDSYMIDLVPASPAHVGRIAARMRDEDVRECRAFARTPKNALRLGLRSSIVSITALVDGSPHAMLGIAPLNVMENIGRPWMLGTEDVMKHGRDLLTFGPLILEQFHRYFARLENLVSVENRKAIRLLDRWGFEVKDDVSTLRGVDFVTFTKSKGPG